jgi:hypothetical protein
LLLEPVLELTGVTKGRKFAVPNQSPGSSVSLRPLRFTSVVLGQAMGNVYGDALVEAQPSFRPEYVYVVGFGIRASQLLLLKSKKAEDMILGLPSKVVAGVGFEPTTFRL